ncbi:NucA/NucB deoxyribonuclease domain-containing protein [Streptococcus respiraculi]|uniref:NucA/NucB deoxyribonuclease domain-containing protein n=1 Tax=Streptococcus respiraculi TaxID=2021971 RepID=UPI00197DCAF1|nr:NucA/NucB deoxyribonuclease domain-containing protein [Streptococcus respiraculi]
MGTGASVATHVTRNISNQVVRQVTRVGIQAGVDTAIDTGLDVAAGNKVTGQTLAMNFGYNLFTNGLGSVSTKQAPKSDVTRTKPMTGEVLDAGYVHNRPVKDVTPTKSSSQKLIGGSDPILALPEPKQQLALPMPNDIVTIQVSKSKYPQSAQHIQNARASGHPSILTINRSGVKTNRRQSLKGIDKVPGMDLDEYPPAMFSEGGAGASVRAINSSDNRGSSFSMVPQLRPFDDGTKVFINITD